MEIYYVKEYKGTGLNWIVKEKGFTEVTYSYIGEPHQSGHQLVELSSTTSVCLHVIQHS